MSPSARALRPSPMRPPAAILRPARWSLRTRLLTVLVSLLALVALALGVATTVALQHFLLGRLDGQLVAAGGRSANAGGPPPGSPGPGPIPGPGDRTDTGARFLLTPGQPPGTLGARVAAGEVTAAGVLSEGGTLQLVPAASLPTDGRPHTRAVAGYGDFRLLGVRMPDGDVLITGLPLRPVTETLYRLVAVEAAVAVVALVAAALAGTLIVRRTLRPLRRVAATAARVSALPLERGEVDLAERVSVADTDPRTEVGQVGAALNRLLDTVGDKLSDPSLTG